MNAEGQYLVELAHRVAQIYVAHPQVRAAMVSGSASEGKSEPDNYP